MALLIAIIFCVGTLPSNSFSHEEDLRHRILLSDHKFLELNELEDIIGYIDLTESNLDIIFDNFYDDALWDNINTITTSNDDIILQKCLISTSREIDLCACQSFDIYHNLNIYQCSKSSSKYSQYNKYYQYNEYNEYDEYDEYDYDEPEKGDYVQLSKLLDFEHGIITGINHYDDGKVYYKIFIDTKDPETTKTLQVSRENIIDFNKPRHSYPEVGDVVYLTENRRAILTNVIPTNPTEFNVFIDGKQTLINKKEIESYSLPHYQSEVASITECKPQIGDKIRLGPKIDHEIYSAITGKTNTISNLMAIIVHIIHDSHKKYFVKFMNPDYKDNMPYTVDNGDISACYKMKIPQNTKKGMYDMNKALPYPHELTNRFFAPIQEGLLQLKKIFGIEKINELHWRVEPQFNIDSDDQGPPQPKKPWNYGYSRKIDMNLVRKIREKGNEAEIIKKLEGQYCHFWDKFVKPKTLTKKPCFSNRKSSWEKFKKKDKAQRLNEAEHYMIDAYTNSGDFCSEFRRYWRCDPINDKNRKDFIKDEDVNYMAAAFHSALHRYNAKLVSTNMIKKVITNGRLPGDIWLRHGVYADVSQFKKRNKEKNKYWEKKQEEAKYKDLRGNHDKKMDAWKTEIKSIYQFVSKDENNKMESFYGPMSFTESKSVATNFANHHGLYSSGHILTTSKSSLGAMLMNDRKKLQPLNVDGFGYLDRYTISLISNYPNEEEVILMNFDLNVIDFN